MKKLPIAARLYVGAVLAAGAINAIAPTPTGTQVAFTFAYDGGYEFTEAAMADKSQLDTVLGGFGPWVASVLVRLGDLRLAFLPQRDLGES